MQIKLQQVDNKTKTLHPEYLAKIVDGYRLKANGEMYNVSFVFTKKYYETLVEDAKKLLGITPGNGGYYLNTENDSWIKEYASRILELEYPIVKVFGEEHDTYSASFFPELEGLEAAIKEFEEQNSV